MEKLRYLSIYDDYSEVVEYCKKHGYLTDAALADEDNVDLLLLFEGDPDYLIPKGTEDWSVYFFIDKAEGIVVTTADTCSDTEAIRDFVEGTGFTYHSTETNRDTDRIYYRGGIGYYYSLYERD